MTRHLFESENRIIEIAPGACLLEGFAIPYETEILKSVEQVTSISPLRKMMIPNGHRMSVAMSNCGKSGWVSDKSGYRYESIDPETGKSWPDMPEVLTQLAKQAVSDAGYDNFTPDVCLINQYEPGTKLSLHRDGDETDFTAPIVSISLGLSATFLFGGLNRQDKTRKIPLHHGDVFVFGGESRLVYHGIALLKAETHPLLGSKRINLTFRKAL